MRRFTALCLALSQTSSSQAKVERMVAYFRVAPAEDAAVALAYLLGSRGRRPVTSTALRQWACEAAEIPLWLFDACYDTVGDLGEALALVLPDSPAADAREDRGLAAFVRDRVLALVGAAPGEARRIVTDAWRSLDADGRFVYHKLIGGAFRMGVARGLVVRAVAEVAGLDVAVTAHRLTGRFEPTAERWSRLLAVDGSEDVRRDEIQPYPFCLASPLAGPADGLGPIDQWLIERKFDGIRCQILHRRNGVAVISRGEDRIDGSFPELVALARRLPVGTALDGEVLAVEGERILPFARLQRRLNAKRGAWRAGPGLFDLERVAFVAYDLLEESGEDRRGEPLAQRRARLERLVGALGDETLRISPRVEVGTWEEAASARALSRQLGVEGLMLKRLDASYGVGRERASQWWKWKVDPYSIDAVLVAAQPGTGRRANLLTDYTFALWTGTGPDRRLVTVAKAYSGLTDAEIAQVDRHARATTVERKGPVRLLTPELVFELGFEGLERSDRHKAGIALRFPRILRWRLDKLPADADEVAALERLLEGR